MLKVTSKLRYYSIDNRCSINIKFTFIGVCLINIRENRTCNHKMDSAETGVSLGSGHREKTN
jgi:hypothetical protein